MDRRQFNLGLLGLGTASALPFGLSACAAASAKASANRTVTGIDTHAHVFHRNLPFVPNRRYTPDYDALPADYYKMLDSNGMSHGVIIPISILGTNNEYTLEVIRRARGACAAWRWSIPRKTSTSFRNSTPAASSASASTSSENPSTTCAAASGKR